MKKIFVLLIFGFQSILGSDWSYGDYSTWTGTCQSGKFQSPINLIPSDTIHRVYSAFNFTNYDKFYPAKVKNNGHSIAITLETGSGKRPTVTGGGLNDEYVLDHIHFHWASEHQVDGYSFPLEMHLVHYSNKYESLSDAAEKQGIAVLGVFFAMSLDDDEDFIPLIEVMDKVERNPSEEVALERQISPKSFIPRQTSDYYRYQGSLTTPGCNEGVTWTVFHNVLPISADQYAHFESIWNENGPLTLNYRPVQPLNGRNVMLRKSAPIRGSTGKGFTIQASILMCTLSSILNFINN